MTRFACWVRALALACACALSLGGCGSDGGLAVFVNVGSITGDAACDGPNGQFPFEESGGLVVIVIVSDETDILLARGTPGTCGDLKAGRTAEIRGDAGNGRVQARQVTLQSR
jgi:hypothetical protein